MKKYNLVEVFIMEYVILILCIIAVIIVAKVFSWPFKKILKLVLNIIVGLFLILVINNFGASINLHIPFNKITALIAGILGIPGVIALVIICYIF